MKKNITLDLDETKIGDGFGHFFHHLGKDIKRGVKKVANIKPVKTLVKDIAPAAIGIAVGAESENPYAGLAAQEAAQQGVNRLYSGKGMETIGIKASDKQLSKLRNGHSVRVLSGATRKLVVDGATAVKMQKAFKNNKGINIKLTKELMEANKLMKGDGIFSKKSIKKGLKLVGREALKEVKKEAKKGLNILADAAGDAVVAELGPVGVPIASVGKRLIKKQGAKAIDNVDKKPKKSKKSTTKAVSSNASLSNASLNELEAAIEDKRSALGLSRKVPQIGSSSGATDDIQGNSYGEGLYTGRMMQGDGLYTGRRVQGNGLYVGKGITDQVVVGIGGSTLLGSHPAKYSRPDLYDFQRRYAL